ncbi:IucA/IucC family protein [Lihuaxuella thermophila]|uniref:Siderophore synthetase component n=1 Tax=Lihuaxuella thermophila TaxID=1173111 RepID=A0A1H8DE79_9BACL|nr:IucA/IucC family protein [Lihuaxuella thermophila]SEN05405.1 Siderophore synthetase component [Lihuaxuella thermophila]
MKTEHLEWINDALQSSYSTQVRRRIFRQLAESLVYENVIPYRTESVRENRDEHIFSIEVNQPDGEPVTYRFQAKRTKTFNRIRITSEAILRISKGVEQEARSLRQFLLDIRSLMEADEQKLVHFIRELEHTWINDSAAQFLRHQQKRMLKGCDYHQLEHRLMDGHPYHPSYKSRIGFDIEENYKYGPEYAHAIRPVWLAVERKDSIASFSRDCQDPRRFVRKELGETLYEAFQEKIRAKGRDPEEYILLPVHPWQWKKQIIPHLQDYLCNDSIIWLGESEDEYGAQQSIRTWTNRSHPEKPYVKLALSIVNTSTGRILAPHTVENAAPISDWLQTVVDSDSYLRDDHQLILLKEVGGISYHPNGPELLQADTYGVVSCIWRESLATKLRENEQAIPFNALTALDVDGMPFIDSYVRQAGLENWVRQLLHTSVLPIIHLLFAHGIAMESHAQNMVLVLNEGMPARLALKDFHDGLRFSRRHLTRPELCPSLKSTPEYHARINRNSFIETDDFRQVRDFMLDAFFFINLGELALFLAEHYSLDEAMFWSWVHQTIRGYQRQFPELKHRFQLFDLYAESIEVEQLTKRRLFPDTELRVHAVPNPLANIRKTEERHAVR